MFLIPLFLKLPKVWIFTFDGAIGLNEVPVGGERNQRLFILGVEQLVFLSESAEGGACLFVVKLAAQSAGSGFDFCGEGAELGPIFFQGRIVFTAKENVLPCLNLLLECDLENPDLLRLGDFALNDCSVVRVDAGAANHEVGRGYRAGEERKAKQEVDSVRDTERFHTSTHRPEIRFRDEFWEEFQEFPDKFRDPDHRLLRIVHPSDSIIIELEGWRVYGLNSTVLPMFTTAETGRLSEEPPARSLTGSFSTRQA